MQPHLTWSFFGGGKWVLKQNRDLSQFKPAYVSQFKPVYVSMFKMFADKQVPLEPLAATAT